jgi:adenylate cyclase class IV
MRLYVQKAVAVGFLVFLTLWIVGAVRGMMLDFPPPLPMSLDVVSARESYSRQQNVNNLKQLGLVETPLPLVLDGPNVEKIRIHEKRAVMTAGSASFDDDSARIHAAIQSHNAEIFTYKKSGIEPHRKLNLEIGVHPDKFDALVDMLRAIGTLSSINVEQKDHTHEFRKLHAERQRLKKNLDDLNKRREGRNLSLDDDLRLLQQTQEIERKIQELSVQFGDLLGKESYYHVHVTLVEHQSGDAKETSYTWPRRVGHAFLWAAVWWFAVALAAAVVVATGVSVWVLRQKDEPKT